MSDLWGNAVPHCPKVVRPEGANVPTLEDSENVMLENILATEQPITTEAVSLVMSVMCEDVAEQEMLFAYKFCRLTTVFVKAMKELHLTEKKMKKLTDDNIKLASELRTVISDYDLFVHRFPITKFFCIGQNSDMLIFAATVSSKYACSLANVPEWSAEAKVLADMILDMWQSDCENVANVATSIDVSA